jgi:hypothetical protein
MIHRRAAVSRDEAPSRKEQTMKVSARVFVVSAAVVVSAASPARAQDVNLTGRYLCIQNCVAMEPGRFAFVTQNGRELNVVNEAGMASRAWFDYPGRIWVDRAQVGAVYSPDAMTIQFDNGTVWQRALELLPAPIVAPPRR